MRRTLIKVVALTGLWACGGTASGDGAQGIPDWDAELDLRIGSVDDPAYSLTWFRTMTVGSDGAMYTLHPQEQVVRKFSRDGAFIRFIGGRGEGPGEFQNVFTLGWVADTLWVLDGSGYRFNQFNPDGALLGSFSVPFQFAEDRTSAGPPRAAGLLLDGTLHGGSAVPSRLAADGTVTSRDRVLMTRHGEVTQMLPAVGLRNSTWAIRDPDSPDQWGMYTMQPFADGPLSDYVPGERAVIYLEREAPETADDAGFHVLKLSFEGDTIWAKSLSFDPDPVSEAEVDSLIGEMAGWLGQRGMPGIAVGQARQWAAAGFYRPDFRPGISAMVMGRDGSIWLSETGGRGDTVSWLILDREGETVARVPLPEDLTPMVADLEYVWGSERDELDVPYLARYRIVKP